ncbi:hypothetical protein CANMA_000443 [Candida margitis]|uniref:uncharacterized protein n=1 Tax=Candida margitis TaxID=1775924 RepID=UPI002227BBDD|nr:uncharacterized protein CANMA_000443 [Candida margitis]KAI5970534.1 hypothetical protein CANMA_000443 [Candida margitis]
MSSAFPRLPRYSGDTDDEHSIHLKRTIGKSNPIRSPRKASDYNGYRNVDTDGIDHQLHHRNGTKILDIDQEISMTLNGVQEDIDEEELNDSYLKFVNNQYDNDYVEDEDEDYILSDGDTYNESFNDDESEDLEYLDYKRRLSDEVPEYSHRLESPRLSKTIDHDEQQDRDTMDDNTLTQKLRSFSWKSALIFVISYATVIIVIAIMMLNKSSKSNPSPEVNLTDVSTRIDGFDQSLQELQRQTEIKLEQISSNIETLALKSAPAGDSEKLVYLKHGQVQVSPQFHKFLYHFLDSYSQTFFDDRVKELQPDKKLDNVDELKEYVDNAISNSIESITSQVEFNVDKILDGLNIVNDTITTDPRSRNTPSTLNKVWINSMLEFISKGSKLVNYADYNQGSRILGFLTSDLDKHNLLQKMWYGWVIFAKNLQNPNNAIHVLLDDDIFWQGGDEIGIRLSTSIIPTDILIQLENKDESPVQASIGFKPYTKAGFEKLKFPKVEDSLDHNINACKFKFIKTSQIRSGINHIKMPIRFVNYQIPGKDIYFKFSKDVKITNIKVYGISDINAVQLQDRFKLLVDEFNVDDTVGLSDKEPVVHDDRSSRQKVDVREEMKVYDINDDIYL